MIVIYLNQENQENENHLVLEKEECFVKWFSLKDGYGFVFSETVPKLKNLDIFLHYSKINQENPMRKHLIKPGDVMICDISQGSKGPQVEKIHEYFPIARPSISGLMKCYGVVKWFNLRDDFGFIKPLKLIKKTSEESDIEEGKNEEILSNEKTAIEKIESNKINEIVMERKNENKIHSNSIQDEKLIFGDKDIFIPGKKIMLMGIEKIHLVPGRKCVCYFRIDEQSNRICEKILFED